MHEYNTRPHVTARSAARWETQKLSESEQEAEARRLAIRRAHSVRRYGITLEQRDALLAAQGGTCALCPAEIGFSGRGFDRSTAHIDHDHATGKVRGILCASCNTALGRLGDSVESLERAVKYLRGDQYAA